MAFKKNQEIPTRTREEMEKVVDLLVQANEALERLDPFMESFSDLYPELLKMIHQKLPEPDTLSIVISDSTDSEMRSPK